MRISRRILFLLGFLGVILVPQTLICSAAPASGLWHLIDADSSETMAFLVASKDAWTVYSPEWSVVGNQVTTDGSRIEFKMRWQGKEITFRGQWQGSNLSGEWQRFHVQYEVKGNWKARHVTSAADWTPLGFTSRRLHGVIDCSKEIRDAMPFADYPAFKNFWEKQFEPPYYALLTIYLYRENRGGYTESAREKKIRAVYDWLARNGERFRKSDSAILELHRTVIHDLEKQFSWFKAAGDVVLLPAAGNFDFSTQLWEGASSPLLVFASDWMAEHLTTEAAQKYFLAQGQLVAFHNQVNYLPDAPLLEVYKRGLALRFSQQLHYSKVEEDLLGVPAGSLSDVAGQFQAYRKAFATKSRSHDNLWVGADRGANSYLAFQFMAGLSEGAVLESFLKMEWTRAAQGVTAFMRADDSLVKVFPLD